MEDRTHASTEDLPAALASPVGERYGRSNDLRRNPDIEVLASVGPGGFPPGTDPNQTWYSGYQRVLRADATYRMPYTNAGRSAPDHASNTPPPPTFAGASRSRLPLDGPKWPGGAPQANQVRSMGRS